jgi:phosphodiesterase/alkaline phosphatase D-like protein
MFTLEDMSNAALEFWSGYRVNPAQEEPKPHRQKLPRRDSQELGPNQLKWLRENVPSFDRAWRCVQAADAHKAKVAKALGVQ